MEDKKLDEMSTDELLRTRLLREEKQYNYSLNKARNITKIGFIIGAVVLAIFVISIIIILLKG